MHEKHSFLLKYGERELKTLKEMQPLKERGLLPDNNNEIFRRGLHCMKQLVGLNEKEYLLEIVQWMDDLRLTITIDPFENIITRSRDIAPLVFSIMMAKYGAQKADLFYSVVVLINSLYNDIVKYLQDKDTKMTSGNKGCLIPVLLPENIRDKAFQIKSAIITFFL